MEAAETYMEMQRSNPQLMGVIGDLAIRSLDLPDGEEAAARMKATIPPQIIAAGEGRDYIPPVQPGAVDPETGQPVMPQGVPVMG
jgi:hypothetical protein